MIFYDCGLRELWFPLGTMAPVWCHQICTAFELLSRDTRPQMKSSSSWPKDFHAAASYNFLQLLGPKVSKNCQREAVLCSCPDMRHQQTNCAHGSSSHLCHHRLLARKLHVDAGVEVCLLVATRTVTSHAAMVSLQHVGATKNTPSSHRPAHWANAPVWKACPFGCTPDDAAILRVASWQYLQQQKPAHRLQAHVPLHGNPFQGMLLDLNFASSQHVPNDFQMTPVTSASPQGPWSEEAAGRLCAPLWCGATCTFAKCPAKEIYDAAEWCPNTENMKWWLESGFITEEKSKSIVIRIMVSMVWNVNWQKSKGFKRQKCRIAASLRSGEFFLAWRNFWKAVFPAPMYPYLIIGFDLGHQAQDGVVESSNNFSVKPSKSNQIGWLEWSPFIHSIRHSLEPILGSWYPVSLWHWLITCSPHIFLYTMWVILMDVKGPYMIVYALIFLMPSSNPGRAWERKTHMGCIPKRGNMMQC